MAQTRRPRGAAILVALIALTGSSTPTHGGDLSTTGWTKSLNNPVLSLSPPGAFDSHNLFAPAIAKHNGVYYLYYSGGPSGPLTGEAYINHQLGLATSVDGVNFQKHGSPLLDLGTEDNFHVTPALLRDPAGNLLRDPDGTWHMIYNGSRADDVRHAISPDGINWSKDPAGVIYSNAYAPNLLKVNDEYRMYYVHKPVDDSPWQIHLAVGPDLHSLQPVANPVLTITQSWERTALFYPYVMKDVDNTWVMFYAAYWNSGSSPTKTAIGVATSVDGITWTKNAANPILKPTTGSSYDSVYVSSQAVIRDNDVYRMFYGGRIDSIHKYFSIGLATKPAPLVPNPEFGDYSGNGTVGPEDYDIWRLRFGTVFAAADGNGNGIVDAGDYVVWRHHLGQAVGSVAGRVATVPEPNGIMLFALINIMAVRSRFTSRKQR